MMDIAKPTKTKEGKHDANFCFTFKYSQNLDNLLVLITFILQNDFVNVVLRLKMLIVERVFVFQIISDIFGFFQQQATS